VKGQRRFALVEVRWTVDASSFPFPRSSQFGGTGYRMRDGVKGLFSVWVEFTDWTGCAKDAKHAKVFALSDEMEFSLPQNGEVFVLTSGATPVAERVVLERGVEAK
jgi:hypothetical protein